MGCDTLVALAPATRERVTLFGKNSDRPPRECQRIVQFPARRHPSGSSVRCQYLELPQADVTAGVLGSRAARPGRLGPGARRVAVSQRLHDRRSVHRPDPRDLRPPLGGAPAEVENVSNGLAIGADWDRGSMDLTDFAVARGWWPRDAGRVDFAAAYADESGVPPNLAGARRRRAAALLAEARGRLTPLMMRAILRDHYDAGPVHHPREFEDEQFFSLCMHADPLDNTTAAMVARLPPDPVALATAWVCLGSPCVGAFLPCYLEGTVPDRLARGGAEADPESPWWRMRELLTLVERDFGRWGPVVRARWDAFEAQLAREAAGVEAEAEAARRAGRTAAALTAFMERAVDAYQAEAERLARELGG